MVPPAARIADAGEAVLPMVGPQEVVHDPLQLRLEREQALAALRDLPLQAVVVRPRGELELRALRQVLNDPRATAADADSRADTDATSDTIEADNCGHSYSHRLVLQPVPATASPAAHGCPAGSR